MPKLYEYFGLYIYFFANDHLPVHVHVKAQSGMCKVIFVIDNGEIKSYDIYQIRKKKMLSSADIKKLKELLNHYGNDILAKWSKFYIENENIVPIRITKRLR